MKIDSSIERETLDRIYRQYNRRKFVHPDPLEFLYNYKDPRDREIVGLIASSLAYGRVGQILISVRRILDQMEPSPHAFVTRTPPAKLTKAFQSFKHRFTTGAEMGTMLVGIRSVLRKHGSLNKCFVSGLKHSDPTVLPAMSRFSRAIHAERTYLVPSPDEGSACKRLNLFLRWMIREDAVDPGGWHGVSPGQLIVPLDTHMAKIGKAFGFTKRNVANMPMALEITESFRKLNPADPVKYDFSLTRFGIRDELTLEALGEACAD